MSVPSSFICPQCFDKHEFKNVVYKCNNTSRIKECSRARNNEPIILGKYVKNPRCTCGERLTQMECPTCGFTIPTSMLTTKNLPISIIGAKESGKSNYVAVLIHQLKNSIGDAFDCSLRADGDRTIERYNKEFYEPLYRKKICLSGSPAGSVPPLIYSLVFNKKKKKFFGKDNDSAVTLTFFDTAGENLDKKTMMKEHNRYLAHSSAIILLLDPLQLPKVREALQGKIHLPSEHTDVNDLMDRVIDIVREGSGVMDLNEQLDIPLAITFTKIDAVFPLLDVSSSLRYDSTHLKQGCFDTKDMKTISAEMESLVKDWMGSELFNKVRLNFRQVEYFGLSALGSNPDIDNKIPKFQPFRVSDPFLWVLSLNHKIDTI